MQKLMKNWIFTMITCILMAVLAVLMFLSGFRVGGMHIGNDVLHIVAAVALTIYVIFTLFPLVARHRGALQGFVIGEIIILLLTAVAHVIMNFDIHIPLLYNLQVCSVLGLALWLRGVVETVHAYLSNTAEEKEKRIPLWRLLCYILLSAVGVWQLVDPLVEDKVFIFVIGAAAVTVAGIFGYVTAMNRKATAAERQLKKAEKAREKADKLLATQRAEEERRASEQAKPQSEPAPTVAQIPAPTAEPAEKPEQKPAPEPVAIALPAAAEQESDLSSTDSF